MRRVLSLLLVVSVMLTLASCKSDPEPKNTVLYDYFDTVTVIYDYSGSSDKHFSGICESLEGELRRYHELFDIYNTYDGVANVAYVNSMAGKGPVKVGGELMDFLEYSKEMYTLTDGYVNIAMGAVLSIWHDYRTEGIENPTAARIPTEAELSAAAEHCDINDLIIDRDNMTVELSDPEMSLDVGAIAKGYAAERLAEWLRKTGESSYALDVGGNLRVVGAKPSGAGWQTGIKNPQGSGYVHTFTITDTSAVTSGGYERYYIVNGERYHHIIDKDTLMPAEHFASVSVVCRDSGLADALSTALFCMDYESGVELIKLLDGVGAVWVFGDGRVEKINI